MAFFERRKHRRNIGVLGLIFGFIALLVISLDHALHGILIGFVALYPSISGILQSYYSKIPGILGTIVCFIAIGYGFFLIFSI